MKSDEHFKFTSLPIKIQPIMVKKKKKKEKNLMSEEYKNPQNSFQSLFTGISQMPNSLQLER